MYSKQVQLGKIAHEKGELFQDQFDNYPVQNHPVNQNNASKLLDCTDLLCNDSLSTRCVRKYSLIFDSDIELESDPNQVRTPKQRSSLFEIDYSQNMPHLNLAQYSDSNDDDNESDRASIRQDLDSRKIFNNMPSKVILAIRSDVDDIQFNDEELSDATQIQTVQKIFNKLIHKVLKEIKAENRRRNILVMILNDVDDGKIAKLKNRKNKILAIVNYLKIVDKYSRNLVNKAKAVLRSALSKMMNPDWVYLKALDVKFRKNETISRIILEQYMNLLSRQLKAGAVGLSVDREQVMGIPSAIERVGF